MDFPNVLVPEENSCNIIGVVRAYKGGPAIGSASISSATCQLNNYADGAVIRAAANVLPDIDVSGNLNHVITGAENTMIDDTKNYEYHVATFKITGVSGGKNINIVQTVFVKVTQNLYET